MCTRFSCYKKVFVLYYCPISEHRGCVSAAPRLHSVSRFCHGFQASLFFIVRSTEFGGLGRVHWDLVKRNDDFSWEHRAVPADSGSIRARQCAQNPPCRTTYPGATLAPHLCIAHAHAHFCHLHKNCALLTKTHCTCEWCCVASPWPRWPAPNTN